MFTAVRAKSPVRQTKTKRTLADRHRSFQTHFEEKDEGGLRARMARSVCWAWREFKYWLCYYSDDEEIDVEELLTNPFNTQPPSLEEISRTTGFQKQWIMFLYRNFKQKCPNGRMTLVQWRQIFRIIFKNASDIEFADRIFLAIAGDRSQKLVTFEDLIMCLHELSQWHQSKLAGSTGASNGHSAMAQFAFNLMQPNEQGHVDLRAFTDYVECVFSLNSRPPGCSEGVFENIITITSSLSNSTFSKVSTRTPAIQSFAAEQFKALDKKKNGYFTVEDLERLFDSLTSSNVSVTSCGNHVDGGLP